MHTLPNLIRQTTKDKMKKKQGQASLYLIQQPLSFHFPLSSSSCLSFGSLISPSSPFPSKPFKKPK